MAEDELRLSGRQVAARLGMDPSTVRRIPRKQLPYEETKGSETRRGRRTYLESAVAAYQRSALARVEAELVELRTEVAGLRAELAELRARVDSGPVPAPETD